MPKFTLKDLTNDPEVEMKFYFNIKPAKGVNERFTRTFVVKALDFPSALDKAIMEATYLWGLNDPWVIEGGIKQPIPITPTDSNLTIETGPLSIEETQR
jgi:hypothetical protein